MQHHNLITNKAEVCLPQALPYLFMLSTSGNIQIHHNLVLNQPMILILHNHFGTVAGIDPNGIRI